MLSSALAAVDFPKSSLVAGLDRETPFETIGGPYEFCHGPGPAPPEDAQKTPPKLSVEEPATTSATTAPRAHSATTERNRMNMPEIALLFAIRLLGLVYTRVVVDLSSSHRVSYCFLFAHGIRHGWGIPAYAGMTWVGVGMAWVGVGMTWGGSRNDVGRSRNDVGRSRIDSRLRGNDVDGSGNDARGSGNEADGRGNGVGGSRIDSRLRGNDVDGSGNGVDGY